MLGDAEESDAPKKDDGPKSGHEPEASRGGSGSNGLDMPPSTTGGLQKEETGSEAVSSSARPQVRVSASEFVRYSGLRHVVAAGESLWSIAEKRLGANASDAEVAAYVQRLWQLNEQRIASGSPDQINVGVVLRLPATN